MKKTFLILLFAGTAIASQFFLASCTDVSTEVPEVSIPSVSFRYTTPVQKIKLPAVNQTGETPDSWDSTDLDVANIIKQNANGVKLEDMDKIYLEKAFLSIEDPDSANNWQNFSSTRITCITDIGKANGSPIRWGSASTTKWSVDNTPNTILFVDGLDIKKDLNGNGVTKLYVGHRTTVVKPTTKEMTMNASFQYRFEYTPKK